MTRSHSGRCEGLQHEVYPQAEALAVAVKALLFHALPIQLQYAVQKFAPKGLYCYREGFRLGVSLMLEALTSATA